MTSIIVGAVVAKALGSSVLSKGANTVVNTMSDFINTPMMRKDVSDIKNLLARLDLEVKMKVIEAYVKEIDEKHKTESVNIALQNLQDIILKINSEVSEIKRKVEYDNKITYLQSFIYRKHNLSEHYKNLEYYSDIFNTRFKLLREIIKSS